MCPAPLTWLLATLLSAPVVAPQPAAPAADKGDSDERALAAAHLETTGPALLDFFRKRTPPGGDRAHLAELVRRLTDQEPAARDRASGELVARGLAAVPLLRQAANNADDGELAGRARQCLEAIEGPSGAALVGSAARGPARVPALRG